MPKVYNVEGALTPGRRIKCSHEFVRAEGNCTRTHEVSRVQEATVHHFTEDVVINGTTYTLNFTGYLDLSGWYIQHTEPMLLGRSQMLRTYYMAYCDTHIPEVAGQRLIAERERRFRQAEATFATPATAVSGIDIDFTAEVAEQPTQHNAVQVPDEDYRLCDNCMYDGGRNGGCPRNSECLGYSDEESNWIWNTDYPGRQERIAEVWNRDEAVRIRNEERQQAREQRRIQEQLERERLIAQAGITGIWCHHNKEKNI